MAWFGPFAGDIPDEAHPRLLLDGPSIRKFFCTDLNMQDKSVDYDQLVAASYERDRQEEEHWLLENRYVRNYFEAREGGALLDLPVGTGRFIDAYPTSTSVLGVDISEAMLGQAQAKVAAGRQITLRLGDGANLPFVASASQDWVVCFRLLHLLDTLQRRAFLRELARVLRGEALVQVYLAPAPPPLWRRVVGKVVSQLRRWVRPMRAEFPWSHIKSYPLTEAQFYELVASVGLRIVARDKLCDYYGSSVEVFRLTHCQA